MLILYLVLLILGIPALVLLLPVKGARTYSYRPPSGRMHEADSVLSRRLLNPGTESYDSYYSRQPGFKEEDDRSRKAPGLLSDEARYFEPASFSASRAHFTLIDHLAELTHGTPRNKDRPLAADPGHATRFVTQWMKKGGAHQVGFTALKDYHLYSHKGRGSRSGEPIPHAHPHAIALTVEMDHSMMQPAPAGSTVMESSEQYLRSGILALKLAAFIRDLGYEATAHIDGNYEVICPLVAVDAGLGTIGRMGLLMTPSLGPRVRIAVVTTNLPLELSGPAPDPSMLHFCELCKKCAENCPSSAIPSGPMEETDGTRRWKIHSEKCYHFWTTSGTDCGRCITVCPYSHRNNHLHAAVRRGIKNNLVFRHLAVKLDDVFYGRKPRTGSLPPWFELTRNA